jgi:hypothetical protein
MGASERNPQLRKPFPLSCIPAREPLGNYRQAPMIKPMICLTPTFRSDRAGGSSRFVDSRCGRQFDVDVSLRSCRSPRIMVDASPLENKPYTSVSDKRGEDWGLYQHVSLI